MSLKDIAKFSYGYTDKAQEHGDTRFLRITDISEDGTLKPDGAKYIQLNEESRKYLVKKGICFLREQVQHTVKRSMCQMIAQQYMLLF